MILGEKIRKPLPGRMQLLDGCVWNDVIEYAVGAAEDGEARLGDFGQVIDDLQENFEGEG